LTKGLYNYNMRGQLTRITSNGSVAEYQDATLPDGSDNNGQIRREIAVWSGAQTTYTYDSLHRLSSWASSMYGTEVYSYDGFGNRTDVPYGANAWNNWIAAYTHDANGNVTGMPNLTLEYDVENRIRRATHATNGYEEYLYDPANQRIAKGELVTFYDVFGKRMAQYKLGNPGWTGEPRLAFYVEGNVTTYTYFQGKILESGRLGSMGAAFNPYGAPKTALAEADGFATYWRDQKTGLDYAINRYYHSALGRFTSPDPYMASGGPGAPQSWNRYAYAENDPINWMDPQGLVRCKGDGEDQYRFGGSACSAPGIESPQTYEQVGTGAGGPPDGVTERDKKFIRDVQGALPRWKELSSAIRSAVSKDSIFAPEMVDCMAGLESTWDPQSDGPGTRTGLFQYDRAGWEGDTDIPYSIANVQDIEKSVKAVLSGLAWRYEASLKHRPDRTARQHLARAFSLFNGEDVKYGEYGYGYAILDCAANISNGFAMGFAEIWELTHP
jgi:RHS repeat-associated protein